MSTAPGCDKILLVQAELDGELDAAQAAALAAHRAECPICQAAAAELARARALIDAEALYQPIPGDVRSRVMAQLTAASSKAAPTLPSPVIPGSSPGRRGLVTSMRRSWSRWWRRWWSSGASFGLGAACAAAVALLVLAPHQPNLAEQIVAGHIRALQPGHLEDVASSDRHTVKPWFDGRLDFAPPVKDLAAQHFPLIGGRLDYVASRPVAALVYQHDKHLIDLFVWPAGTSAALPPEAAQRQGYNVVHWIEDGMRLWAVSDLEASQLREFAEEWRRMRD
jgi:anti-sigma factor RsiW